MLTKYLIQLCALGSLEEEEAKEATERMLEGADPTQAAGFMALLRAKGETSEELLGMIEALNKQAAKVQLHTSVLDIVGTGGDGQHTLNISTGAALLAAACGVPVAKHGNRSVSSRCGAADIIEGLGIPLLQSEEEVVNSIESNRFSFLFAPHFHHVLKKLASIRRTLKIPTTFNILGPLLNPAKADYLLLGVFAQEVIEPMAHALCKSRIKRALVFHGSGLDELSPVGIAKGMLVESRWTCFSF